MRYAYFQSPVGKLLLAGTEQLERISFPTGKTKILPEKNWDQDPQAFKKVRSQLDAYFQGGLKAFELNGQINLIGTDFQKKVWNALVQIPYGETTSYGEIAKKIGNENASRAVGMANGKNPIPIIFPCHRVIGKDGSLTGFGGGLEIKQMLLNFEKKFK